MNNLDQSKLDYYLKFPELILESGKWESYAICQRCLGEVPIYHSCLKGKECIGNEKNAEERSCPNCKIYKWEYVLGKNDERKFFGQYYIVEFHPIDHIIMRRRYHVTSRTPPPWWKFWHPIKTEGFWEVEEIENNTKKDK